MLVGGGVAEQAAFQAQNQYEERIERVADERIEVRDRITDAEATLNRWGGEEQLTIKRQKDRTNVPFVRLMEGSRKERAVAKVTMVDGTQAFEFDIELLERPDTNVFTYELEGWEDLDFFYQPPLNEEMASSTCTATDCGGAHRPENVVGSYAVYHKTKRNHVQGETNFQTGKLYHIYRPLVYDAEGNEVWGELHYEAGRLSVTVPQEFLDSAMYPVIVDPTFGYTSVGASTFAAQDDLIAERHSLGENGDVESLSWYFRITGTSPQYDIWMAVYNTSRNLIANSSATRYGSTVASWKTQTVTTSLATGTYRLVAVNDYISGSSASITSFFDNIGASGDDEVDINVAGLVDPYGADLSTTRRHSIYATYTASEPEPPANTCTPTTGQQWNVDLADNCTFSTDIYHDAGMTCAGTGSVTVESGVTVRVASSTCPQITVKSGGRFINGI